MTFSNPNEEQEEARKATQFGGEKGNPRSQELPGTNAPWSIRHKLRYLATQELDPTDADAMKKCITHDGARFPTVAETIAAAILTRASSGNIKAAESAMQNIEGKLPLPVKYEGDPAALPPPNIQFIFSDEKLDNASKE